MEEKQTQFRTAAFGGFNKQDVLAYLEASAREQEEKLAALRREVEEARKAGDEAREKADAGESRLTALEEENQRLAGDLAARADALAQAEARRDELEAQVKDLAAQVEKLAPAAQSYEAVKERTAGIELEAHGRAQAIELAAQGKAKKTKAEMETWFGRLENAYSRLRSELDATITRAAGELEQVSRSLEGISGEFAAQDAALKELEKTVETLTGPKAPQPLKLEEK